MSATSLLWLIKRIKKRIPSLLLMTMAQIGHALLLVYFALGSKNVIDSAVSGDPQAFVRACVYQGQIIIGILLCLTVVRHQKEYLSATLDRDWKRQLLHGLLHGEYAQVRNYHSAELINRLNNDVQKVNDGILTIIPSAAAMITKLVAAVIVLGTLDSRFTVIIVCVGAVVVTATAFMRRKLKILNKQVSEQDGKVSGFLQETMEKLLMIQAMDVSEEVENRADSQLNIRYNIQRKRKNVALATNTGISILYYGAGFATLLWCSYRMLLGQMSFGSLTAAIQLINQLQAPFVNLSGVLPKYVAMVASAERLMELETIQSEPASRDEAPNAVYQQMEAICAEDVSFSYDRDQILDNASFSLPKGAFAVITGQSGIGKSTLLKLLLGVFQPQNGKLYMKMQEGEICIDRSTRGIFSYVPQGNMLFSGSIRENLLLVNPNATEEELEQAIHVSAVDEFLPQLPMGLDTLLGESGAGISEGQAQRVAIARAILMDAPILLLDECTSALDEETEQLVLRRIRELPNRTCIAVTHRPAANALCNWRLEVSDGKIRAVCVADEAKTSGNENGSFA